MIPAELVTLSKLERQTTPKKIVVLSSLSIVYYTRFHGVFLSFRRLIGEEKCSKLFKKNVAFNPHPRTSETNQPCSVVCCIDTYLQWHMASSI